MADPGFSDETLMAFADGELDEATALRVSEAAARDEAVAKRLRRFAETHDLLAREGERRKSEPVPGTLLLRARQTIAAAEAARESDTPVPEMPSVRSPRASMPRRSVRWGALAASVALVAGAVGGFVAADALQEPRAAGGLRVALVEDPAILGALNALPSGERARLPDGSVIAPVATFETAGDALCREFEYETTDGSSVVSVACRAGSGWMVRFATTVPSGGREPGYAPASSLDVLDAYLDLSGAGAPMSRAEEAAALQAADAD